MIIRRALQPLFQSSPASTQGWRFHAWCVYYEPSAALIGSAARIGGTDLKWLGRMLLCVSLIPESSVMTSFVTPVGVAPSVTASKKLSARRTIREQYCVPSRGALENTSRQGRPLVSGIRCGRDTRSPACRAMRVAESLPRKCRKHPQRDRPVHSDEGLWEGERPAARGIRRGPQISWWDDAASLPRRWCTWLRFVHGQC